MNLGFEIADRINVKVGDDEKVDCLIVTSELFRTVAPQNVDPETVRDAFQVATLAMAQSYPSDEPDSVLTGLYTIGQTICVTIGKTDLHQDHEGIHRVLLIYHVLRSEQNAVLDALGLREDRDILGVIDSSKITARFLERKGE